jgi:hypothetical protein
LVEERGADDWGLVNGKLLPEKGFNETHQVLVELSDNQ